MKRRATLILVCGLGLGCAMLLTAQVAQRPDGIQDPYVSLAGRVETRLRFVTDFSFPQGPAFQVKVYDWIIGPRQEITDFPLEGFTTFELKAGTVETTIGGVTARYHEGEHWVVPEGSRLDIRVPADATPGDNLASLHGVAAIRK